MSSIKAHRRIGVVMNKPYKYVNAQALQGIIQEMKPLGYSASIMVISDEIGISHQSYGTGERNLINALNFNEIDGLIFMPFTLTSDEFLAEMREVLNKKCNKPIVTIGGKGYGFTDVWHDDRAESASIVRHLIEEHGCRRIYYLTGKHDMETAEERLYGYRDAMDEAGLHHGEDTEFYGDFWYSSGEELADKVLADADNLPDAVACANDQMAIALCNRLIKNGIRVPEDIRITGFDGTQEALENDPPVSTYFASPDELGRRAMRLLALKIEGVETESIYMKTGTFLGNASCGCSADKERYVYEERRELPNVLEEKYMDPHPDSRIMAAESLDSFSAAMQDIGYIFTDDFTGMKFHLCLCDDWDKVNDAFAGTEERQNGYSQQMLSLSLAGSRVWFNTADMLPPELREDDDPSFTFFTAIHFSAHCFGYALLTLYDAEQEYSLHYAKFCQKISNGLELLCVRNQMKSYAHKSYLSDIRDTLTGVYRMNAMPNFWGELFEKAEDRGGLVFMIGVSVFSLQKITEMFGQIKGDELINAVANMLLGCCRNGEICIRADENEFLIIGQKEAESSHVEFLKSDIKTQLEKLNQSSQQQFCTELCIASGETASYVPANEFYSDIKTRLREEEMASRMRGSQSYTSALISLRRDIYQNPKADWSLNICSQRIGVCVSHFHRQYNSLFGVSCMNDVQNSKLGYAKKLLLETDYTLQAIADECGYDYSHFMRLFKRAYGMTPTAYRKSKK